MFDDNLVSAHIHPITNEHNEDIIDLFVFCSDFCHRQYLAAHQIPYEGWYGCQEISEQPCTNCSDLIGSGSWRDTPLDGILGYDLHTNPENDERS